MLIARYTPMMSISTLAKGGTVLTGNAIAFHQPLQTLASVLPRRLNDTCLLFVVRGLSSEEDLVALYLLPPRSGVYVAPLFDVPSSARCIVYCPPYVQDGVTVCDASLNLFPEDGSVFDDAFGFGQGGVCDKCGVGSGVCMCFVHVVSSDSVVADDAQDLGPAPVQGLGSESEGAQSQPPLGRRRSALIIWEGMMKNHWLWVLRNTLDYLVGRTSRQPHERHATAREHFAALFSHLPYFSHSGSRGSLS